MYFSTE